MRIIRSMVDDEFRHLPEDLPVPENDGACDHLRGLFMPHVRLQSTGGGHVDVGDTSLGRSVFFFYPRTGIPGVPLPEGWDSIPGARGCTAESCGYRDSYDDFRLLGWSVFGVSSQTAEEQREFAAREHIQFALLSDHKLELADALRLPTFHVEGVRQRLIRRLTLVVVEGKIDRFFYPIFPPDRNAHDVLEALRSGRQAPGRSIERK